MKTRSLLTALTLTATLGLTVGCGESETTDVEGAANEAGEGASSLIDQGTAAVGQAGDAAKDLMSKLDGMKPADAVAKLESLIGEGKLDEAKKLYEKLKGVAEQLPEELQTKLKAIGSELTGSDVNIPGLGG